ncbi:hypothetical protein GA0061099_10585 [Bradyrhizobium yuanmingense]|uniref:Uncharacterized protein n=1 Tax=Bradyrhizobium yuanmingense TaxID=108015 RepID=A0A1C3XM31_9BRAD|nr:hypothetical protein GA0061099_10585 [Bradyrhizobium yuanmingense]
MRNIVREGARHSGEHVLDAFAGKQITVGQRQLTERRHQVVPRPIEGDVRRRGRWRQGLRQGSRRCWGPHKTRLRLGRLCLRPGLPHTRQLNEMTILIEVVRRRHRHPRDIWGRDRADDLRGDRANVPCSKRSTGAPGPRTCVLSRQISWLAGRCGCGAIAMAAADALGSLLASILQYMGIEYRDGTTYMRSYGTRQGGTVKLTSWCSPEVEVRNSPSACPEGPHSKSIASQGLANRRVRSLRWPTSSQASSAGAEPSKSLQRRGHLPSRAKVRSTALRLGGSGSLGRGAVARRSRSSTAPSGRVLDELFAAIDPIGKDVLKPRSRKFCNRGAAPWTS